MNFSIPDTYAKEINHYTAFETNAKKIIILLQTYDNWAGQENIKKICEYIKKDTGLRLVTVEGAYGEIHPDPLNTDIKNLLLRSDISAGVMSFLNSDSTSVNVRGVDNMSYIEQSRKSMAVLQNSSLTRESFFNEIKFQIEQSQRRIYSQSVANLRKARLNLFNLNKTLSDQINSIKEACKEQNISLDKFPSINKYIFYQQQEQSINKKRAARQQAKFVKRLVKRLHSWYKLKSKNVVNFDLKKALPILNYWMIQTGQSEEELKRNIERSGPEPVFLSLKEWIDGWLLSVAGQANTSGSYSVYEEYEKMALFIDEPFFDLLDFRRLVASNRAINELKTTLDDEINDCTDVLIKNISSPAAIQLQRIENEFNLLYNALRLTVTPNAAEYALINSSHLNNLVNDLASLSDPSPSSNIPAQIQEIGRDLDAAGTFYNLSRLRGEQMISNTLDIMNDLYEEIAILVVGGFHQQAITRILEDKRDISWAIYSVNIELKEIRSKFFM